MPATSPDPEHFVVLADHLIRALQTETICMCHAPTDADRRHHTAAVIRITSIIRRHLAADLERAALF